MRAWGCGKWGCWRWAPGIMARSAAAVFPSVEEGGYIGAVDAAILIEVGRARWCEAEIQRGVAAVVATAEDLREPGDAEEVGLAGDDGEGAIEDVGRRTAAGGIIEGSDALGFGDVGAGAAAVDEVDRSA